MPNNKALVKRAVLLSVLALLMNSDANAFIGALPQLQKEYCGKLDSELTAGLSLGIQKPMTVASENDRKLLPDELKAEDQALIGALSTRLKKQLLLALVRPKDGAEYLFVDINFDGRFDRTERFALSPLEYTEVEGASLVFLSLSRGPFTAYPVRIAIIKDKRNPGTMLPAASMWVHARGKVDIDGRTVLVSYPFDPATGVLNPNYGWLGMDCNGDGKIEEGPNSPEWKFADHQIVGFRVGQYYLSTQSVDLATGKITLLSLPTSASSDIELVLRKQIADLAFTDFDGRRRNISEFKGKYVLFDFWATWCGPCLAEIPSLRSAYEKFRERGLEIVGINSDEDLAKAKQLVIDGGVSWPQATNESVKNRLYVDVYPTTILLDPGGKIISLGEKNELRGQNLEKTLEKLLPPKQP